MLEKDKVTFPRMQEIVLQGKGALTKTLNVSILRNIVVEPVIESCVAYHALPLGYDVKITLGEYDNVFQEAVGGNEELLNASTDCVMVFLNIDALSPALTKNFLSTEREEIKKEQERIPAFVYSVLTGIRKQTNAMIVWHAFELPVYPSMGVSDSLVELSQSRIIHELNENVKDILKEIKDSGYVDVNVCMTRIGAQSFYDKRYWHIGRAPYSYKALLEITFESFRYIRAAKGKNKKCLVLDCDNVLWGGILGEDGVNGVKLGKSHPGSEYYEFQQEVLNLYSKGIIIALCSKNNEADVIELLAKHPDMLLKEKHIAAHRINWEDKATNIQMIAEDLNIGLDSIVFMDDSEHEISLVRQMLPQVEAIHLNPAKPAEYREVLLSSGFFDTLQLTAEDKVRGEMYKTDVERKKHARQSVDMQAYYESLKMTVEISLCDDFAIPRVAQLSKRTNQFNLTVKRYSESDIQDLTKDGVGEVVYLKLGDAFGDMGIVGAYTVTYHGDTAAIESLFLSCRALGRKVEDLMLWSLFELLKSRGIKKVRSSYIKAERNSQVKDFYDKRGFQIIKSDNNSTLYERDLRHLDFIPHKYFRYIIMNINNTSDSHDADDLEKMAANE
jgi:FkbH-like protein